MTGLARTTGGAVAATVIAAVMFASGCACLPCKRVGAQARAVTEQARAVSLAQQLEGSWVGHPVDSDEKWEWTIKNGKIEAQTAFGDYYKGTVERVDDSVTPARVQIKLTDCSDTSLEGETVLGIVKLEGRKVTFCFGDPAYGGYPSAFDSGEALLLVGEKR